MKVVGQRLQDVLPRLKRRTLDVIVEVVVTRRVYRGVQSQVTRRFRLVGIYNEERVSWIARYDPAEIGSK